MAVRIKFLPAFARCTPPLSSGLLPRPFAFGRDLPTDTNKRERQAYTAKLVDGRIGAYLQVLAHITLTKIAGMTHAILLVTGLMLSAAIGPPDSSWRLNTVQLRWLWVIANRAYLPNTRTTLCIEAEGGGAGAP